jgi:hypothetical protein
VSVTSAMVFRLMRRMRGGFLSIRKRSALCEGSAHPLRRRFGNMCAAPTLAGRPYGPATTSAGTSREGGRGAR